jgi:hypothetical protein
MTKRLLILIGVAVALLVLAVPAMAWNGYREDYTTTDACQLCHSGIAGIPDTYNQWVETGHANSGGRANRLPYGSSCGGCHSSNFDPSKIVPSPTATNATTGAVSWTGANAYPVAAQALGNAATSEAFVGCSSCHYGANVGGDAGADANDTAHNAPYANLADAQICGQCHSRYSYSVMTHDVLPVPYMSVDPAGSPIPNPNPTTLLQPQYASGYKMLGEPTAWVPAGLATVLNVQHPGWTPTPNPAATSPAGLQVYWQVDGVDTPWQYRGHDGSANQYADWAIEGHATALEGLKAVMGPNPPQRCLECHSADYRIAVESGKTPPTGAEAKYGITCVGCHTPHDNGTAVGEWSEEFHPQLRTDSQKTLCVECHNGELPEGTEAAPGTEIHHPMKEMIDGYGAIDVSSFPSVHKDKCVQCHMPPTTTSPTGGNHTFQIIEPEVAAEAIPNPLVTNSPTPKMPYSSCSGANGCHTRQVRSEDGTMVAEPYGLYLQDTIEQRQEWTHARITEIWALLDKVAVDNGYADAGAARDAFVEEPENTWTTTVRAYLSSFTNVEFVESEGSFGIHNWDYSREIVNTAMMQAKVAESGVIVRTPWVVTLKMSKSNVKKGTRVKFSGTVKTSKGVAGAGTVRIMRRVGGKWQVWLKDSLNSSGNYSVTQKLTRTGTFRIRAFMPANTTSLGAYSSPSRKLVVRR